MEVEKGLKSNEKKIKIIEKNINFNEQNEIAMSLLEQDNFFSINPNFTENI